MEVQVPYRILPPAAYLHGTASAKYVSDTERKHAPVDCNKDIKQECKAPSRKRLKSVLKCCFPCIRKTSESYSVREVPVSGRERETQDRAMDAYLRHLIANTGRPVSYAAEAESDHDHAAIQGQNETLVKGQGDTLNSSRNFQFEAEPRSGSTALRAVSDETLMVQKETHRKQEETSRKQEVTSRKQEVTSRKQEVTSRKQEVTSRKQEVTSRKQVVRFLKIVVTNGRGVVEDADRQRAGVDRDAQHAHGSLVEDLKETLQAVSADLNQTSDQTHTSAPRPSVRSRPLRIDIQKLKGLQPKDLQRFRYPPAHHLAPLTQMMSSSRVLSGHHRIRHPQFSDFSARKESFRNCRDDQLSGYNQVELARAGWFFNQGVLVTFCCELALPSHPAGSLQNIHQEKSPQCHFAASLQSSTPDSGIQTGGAEGSFSFGESVHFSIPVQVSDHDPRQPGTPPELYGVGDQESSPGQPGTLAEHSHVVYQESSPGGHWETDWFGPDSRQTLTGAHAFYPANLVTNETHLTSPGFEPYVADWGQRPRNPEATQGQLTMRGTVPNPLVSRAAAHHDHVLENLDQAGALLDYLAHFDQLNMVGGGEVEHRPRHPHFGAPPIRNESFHQGWPAHHSHTACSLADAGFFYAGYGDSVLCYSCGIGVRRWVPGDNPWIEHARLWPLCVFVKTVQGQHFIDAAKEMTANNRHPTYRDVKLEANRRQQAEEGDRGVLAGISFRAEDAGIELLCRFCYRRERTHLMIPCHHMAVCEECSWPKLSCPDCHAYVEETIQA